MKIVYIHKAQFQNRPPVISTVMLLCDLGYQVDLITCGISNDFRKILERKNVKIHVVPGVEYSNTSGRLNKILEYYRFRHAVEKILKRFYHSGSTVLWLEGNYTFLSLGSLIKNYRYILQIQELSNDHKLQFKAISNIISKAELVFMPEYCRTVLFQNWFHLKHRPAVLENKPYFLPDRKQLEALKEKYKNTIRLLDGKKNILFQGGISSERNLTTYVSAIRRLHPEYQMVLLGKDQGMLHSYLQINPDILHIDHMIAPDYLLITSLCHIGIVTYDPMTLNSAFCAPNKIFEYSAYSLPMIGNDIPGLRFKFERFQSGLIIDDSQEENIINAICEIDKNYDRYQKNAGLLYSSVDNKKILSQELNKIHL